MRKKILAVLLTAAMLLSMVAITASAAESSFSDTANNWAEASIERWAESGVIHGTDTGLFQPGKKMTRAEFATVLCQLLKIDDPGTVSFNDLSGHWGSKAMRVLANAGILSGVGGNRADPDGLITREQAFALLARALHIPESTSDDTLPGVSGWAQGAVKALTERGIVKGTVNSDGTVELAPKTNIDKASMMSLLDRTVTTYADKPGSYENTAENGVALVVTDGEVVISGQAAAVVVPSAGEGADVTLSKAVVTEGVTVDAADVSVTVSASKVEGGVALTENANKATVDVNAGSSIDTVTTAAEEVTVSGEGEVKEVAVVGGDKVDVTTAGTTVSVAEDAADATVTAGGSEVKPGEDATIDGSAEGYVDPSTQPSTAPTEQPGGDTPATEKVTVTFNLNGAEGTAPTAQEITKGGKATQPTAPTWDGHTFGGWFTSATPTEGAAAFDFDTAVNADTTLYAKWTAKSYNLTYAAGTGATGVTGLPAATTALCGSTVTLPAGPTSTSHNFSAWTSEDVTISGSTFTMPAKNVTITATWTINTYTVTFKNADGTEAGTETVNHGGTATAPTLTKTGYELSWKKGEVAFDLSTAITENTELTAVWTLKPGYADSEKTLNAAIAAAPTDTASTITLVDNITVKQRIDIDGKPITLDGGNCTLTAASDFATIFTNGAGNQIVNSVVRITNGVTVKNLIIDANNLNTRGIRVAGRNNQTDTMTIGPNVTIKNAKVTTPTSVDDGAGGGIANDAPSGCKLMLTLNSVTITNCSSCSDGGAVFFGQTDGTLTIAGTTKITGCSATGFGGAINIGSEANLDIENCDTISNNTTSANRGANIYLNANAYGGGHVRMLSSCTGTISEIHLEDPWDFVEHYEGKMISDGNGGQILDDCSPHGSALTSKLRWLSTLEYQGGTLQTLTMASGKAYTTLTAPTLNANYHSGPAANLTGGTASNGQTITGYNSVEGHLEFAANQPTFTTEP